MSSFPSDTSLNDLRAKIDALDAQLLRLVDERAELGKAIGEAKAQHESSTEPASLLRPDREALLIRKLLAMPRQAASDTVIVRIWRELISENLRIQGVGAKLRQAGGGLHLNISAGENSQETLLWARERFGAAPAYSLVDDPAAAIAAARDVRHISVLNLDPRSGAWWARLLAEPKVRVIAALPELTPGRPHALAVASLSPEPTGDDTTFWVSDSAAREADIVTRLGDNGLAAEWLCTAQGLKLFAISGFVQENDPRLGAPALGSLSGIIGAAPRL